MDASAKEVGLVKNWKERTGRNVKKPSREHEPEQDADGGLHDSDAEAERPPSPPLAKKRPKKFQVKLS
jgi:hypothetical protein